MIPGALNARDATTDRSLAAATQWSAEENDRKITDKRIAVRQMIADWRALDFRIVGQVIFLSLIFLSRIVRIDPREFA
jgi:hypothetical protein